MTISMHPVKSSHIAEIGHSDTTLRVKFRDGTVHEYDGVNADLFQRLHGAESVGSFLSKEIKGKFSHRKLHGEHHAG